jgi:hypothetical protein
MIDIRSEINPYKDDDLVCCCFGYTRADIEKDYIDNTGQSTILERITFEKKAENCDCAHRNPKGR